MVLRHFICACEASFGFFHRLCALSAALLSGIIAGMSYAASEPTHGEALDLATGRVALEHRVRTTRDPRLVAELRLIIDRAKSGDSSDDIIRHVLDKRRHWANTRDTAITGNYELDEDYKTVVLGLSRTATGIAGSKVRGLFRLPAKHSPSANDNGVWPDIAENAGDILGAVGIEAFESWNRSRVVPQSARRYADQYNDVDHALSHQLQPLWNQTYDCYRMDRCKTAYDTLLMPNLGFRPTDDRDDILRKYPSFKAHEEIGELLAKLNDDRSSAKSAHAIATKHLGSQITGFQDAHDTAAQKQDNFRREVRERWAAERERTLQRQREETRRLELEGYRALANLAATAVGLSDPELGFKLQAISDGAYKAVRAFDKMNKALSVTPLASAIFTGDVVGAVLGVVAAFVDTGPTADEIIIEELDTLRKQVHQLRHEMHQRFDLVHEHINGVQEHIDLVYKALSGQLEFDREVSASRHEAVAATLRTVKSELESARTQLDQIIDGQTSSYKIVMEENEAVRNLVESFFLAPCERTRDLAAGDPMSYDDFLDCLSLFTTLTRALKDAQVGHSYDALTVAELMEFRPHRTTNLGLQTLRYLYERAPDDVRLRLAMLPDSVVSPEMWFAVMDRIETFLDRFPQYAARAARNDQLSLDDIKRMRVDLTHYAAGIRDEFRAFAHQRSSVIDVLFEELDKRSEELDALVRAAMGAYYRSEHYLFETRTHANGRVQVELKLENGPRRGFAPLRRFVTKWPWLTFQCNPARRDDQYDDVLRNEDNEDFAEVFGGARIERFVEHRADLFPARLGMGTVQLCAKSRLKRASLSATRTRLPDDFHTIRMRLKGEERKSVRITFQGANDCSELQLTNESDRERIDVEVSGIPSVTSKRGAATTSIGIPTPGRTWEEVVAIREDFILHSRLHVRDGDWQRRVPRWVALERKAQRGDGRLAGGACHRQYLSVFRDRQQELSDFVRTWLLDAPEFHKLDKSIARTRASLRAWISLAFRDALLQQSELVSRLVSGGVSLPSEFLAERTVDGCFAWELRDVEDQEREQWRERCGWRFALRGLESSMRSEAMQDVVNFGFGNEMLADSVFYWLGEHGNAGGKSVN